MPSLSPKHYAELGGLISTAPDLLQYPASTELLTWFGRVHALLNEMGDMIGAVAFKQAFARRQGSHLQNPQDALEAMRQALYSALGTAERLAPSEQRGAYLPVNSPHDVLVAIARVFGEAKQDVFVVDPYLDQTVLNDFALSVPDGTPLRLLTGDKKHHANLAPALRLWRQQHSTRSVEIHLVRQAELHDRLIIVDGKAWWLSQSFNQLAKRSPASLQPFDADLGALKAAYYSDLWKNGAKLPA